MPSTCKSTCAQAHTHTQIINALHAELTNQQQNLGLLIISPLKQLQWNPPHLLFSATFAVYFVSFFMSESHPHVFHIFDLFNPGFFLGLSHKWF